MISLQYENEHMEHLRLEKYYKETSVNLRN